MTTFSSRPARIAALKTESLSTAVRAGLFVMLGVGLSLAASTARADLGQRGDDMPAATTEINEADIEPSPNFDLTQIANLRPVFENDPLQPVSNVFIRGREKAEPYGLEFGLGITSIVQAASDRRFDDDERALWTYSLDFAGQWTFIDRENNPGGVGWLVESGRPIVQDHDADLSWSVGSFQGINDDLLSEEAVVTELWYTQQLYGGRFNFTLGKIDLTNTFDGSVYANDETTQFLATPLVNNLAIPFPENGLGIVFDAQLPVEGMNFRAGFADAAAKFDRAGFDTLEESDLFAIGELSYFRTFDEFDLIDSTEFRFIGWRTESGDMDGGGLAFSWDVNWKCNLGWNLRYGYANEDVSEVKHAVSTAFAWEAPFGREADTLAIGMAWAKPADVFIDDEILFETYYRVQLTDTLEVSPSLQWIVNPGQNLDEDFTVIGGARVQFTF